MSEPDAASGNAPDRPGTGLPIRRASARFARLPFAQTRDGEPRRTGVEIEFGGLREGEAARIIRRRFGGRLDEGDRHNIEVRETRLGDFKVELDTAFADKPQIGRLGEAALELSRAVVPIEIVTDPLTQEQLEELPALTRDLAGAGATGTQNGVLLGFGVHFNTEVRSLDAGDWVPVFRAYLLLEDWLRGHEPLDISRRMLPFVTPFPRDMIDVAARDGADWTLESFCDAYLSHSPSRNRGLDMLPLLKTCLPERIEDALGAEVKINARPTFHFRLPDCRIDDADWSLSHEWNHWCLIEHLAADAAALAALAEQWLDYRAALTSTRGDWQRMVVAFLTEEGFWEEGGTA